MSSDNLVILDGVVEWDGKTIEKVSVYRQAKETVAAMHEIVIEFSDGTYARIYPVNDEYVGAMTHVKNLTYFRVTCHSIAIMHSMCYF